MFLLKLYNLRIHVFVNLDQFLKMGVDMVSLGSKLDEHDRKWAWKFYLRNLAIIVALAGIVCVVWPLTHEACYYDLHGDYCVP